MYVVSSLDIRGLNTQGKTIEQAIENAHDAAALLAEYRASEIQNVKDASKMVGMRSTAKIAKRVATSRRQDKARVKVC